MDGWGEQLLFKITEICWIDYNKKYKHWGGFVRVKNWSVYIDIELQKWLSINKGERSSHKGQTVLNSIFMAWKTMLRASPSILISSFYSLLTLTPYWWRPCLWLVQLSITIYKHEKQNRKMKTFWIFLFLHIIIIFIVCMCVWGDIISLLPKWSECKELVQIPPGLSSEAYQFMLTILTMSISLTVLHTHTHNCDLVSLYKHLIWNINFPKSINLLMFWSHLNFM